MTLPTRPNAPSQAHLQGTQSQHTKANLAKEPVLCQRTAYAPQRTDNYQHQESTSAIYLYWAPSPPTTPLIDK
jgi:hypothetical protein